MKRRFTAKERVDLAYLAGKLYAACINDSHLQGDADRAAHVLYLAMSRGYENAFEEAAKRLTALGALPATAFRKRMNFIDAMSTLWEIERLLGLQHCRRTAQFLPDEHGKPDGSCRVLWDEWTEADKAHQAGLSPSTVPEVA